MSSFDETGAGPLPSKEAPPSSAGNHDQSPSLTSEGWGQAARASVLFTLLGMALTVFTRLSFGRSWVLGFLRDNNLPMSSRIALMVQMVVVGVVFGVIALVLMAVKRTRVSCRPAVMEQWAWFLSPLILLPAPIVVLQHGIWTEHHKDLLPIILFGGILAEFFLTQAGKHVPSVVSRLVAHIAGPEPQSLPPIDTEKQTKPGWFRRFAHFCDRHTALLVVIAAACAYGAFMSFFTVRWHHKLGTAIFDLGINNNLLYGGLSGHINESTVIFPEEPAKYLANHVKWGLYAFLPIYAVFPRPETLLIIQSIFIGLGAIPLYLFCRDRLPQWWAVALSLSYLCYYPLHSANFYEMKEPPVAAVIILFCIWAVDNRKYWFGAFCFLWAMIMREDMPIPLAVAGGVFLLSGRRPIPGLVMTAVATTWFVFIRFRLMNDAGAWWFPNMYKDLWAAPERGFQGVVKTLVSNPSFTLKHIFVEKKFWYLMHLLVPLLFLPARRWYTWAAFVPGAILTLLVTDYAPPIMFSFQYVMYWAPYLFLAAALVISSKLQVPGGRPAARGALMAMCLTTAGLSYNYGAFPLREKSFQSGYHRISFTFDAEDQARYRDVEALVRTIPSDATVAATEHVGAHLSSRLKFYTLRRDSHNVTFIVARKKELSLDKTRRTIFRALDSGKYGVAGRFGEFAVLKRGADTKDNDALIEEWRLQKGDSSRRRVLERRNEADENEADSTLQDSDGPNNDDKDAEAAQETAEEEPEGELKGDAEAQP